MTKQKISSKLVRARSLAMYELEQFIGYIRSIEPELRPDQVVVLTAFILNDLPKLFQQNPKLLERIKEIAENMRLEDRR